MSSESAGINRHIVGMGEPYGFMRLTHNFAAFLSTSARCLEVKLFATLPDPPLFGLIAALARLLWPVATATVNLRATPDCWTRSEETYDEFENVNRGCYADKRIDH